jgi:type II secretory pathway pseudopilin PulG
VRFNFRDGKLLAVLAAIVAVAAVATSLWLNPPSLARERRMDTVRMQGLYQTEMAIQSYYEGHRALPTELKALDSDNEHHRELDWHDPETKQPFEYAVAGETSYRLCAVFSQGSDQHDPYIGFDGTHKAGRDCFQKTVTVKAAQ